MNISEYLENVKKAIDTPEKWTKDVIARTSWGAPVSITNQHATCFCLIGALKVKKEEFNINLDDFFVARGYIRESINNSCSGYKTIPEFNDHEDTKHEDVMMILDQAIQTAKDFE